MKILKRISPVVIGLAALALPGVAAAQGEITEYYALDAIGSVRVVFESAGAVTARMDYVPFGADLSGAAGVPKERFAGIFRDGEVGLDHAQARSYQGRHGRFTAPDSVYAGLFEPQGWNRYSYSLNNPLLYVDPTGLNASACAVDYCTTVVGSYSDMPIAFQLFFLGFSWGSWGGGGDSSFEIGGGGGGHSGGTQAPNPENTPTASTPNNPIPNPTPNPNTEPTEIEEEQEDNRSMWDCYRKAVAADYDLAHKAIFDTSVAHVVTGATAVGRAFSNRLTQATGLATFGMLVDDAYWTYKSFQPGVRIYGVANLGVGGTLVSSTLRLAGNAAFIYPALKAGVAAGSAIRPLFLPNFGGCGAF